VVHLADILARNAGIGSGGDPLIPMPDAGVIRRLRVTPSQLQHWTDKLADDREAVETYFQVVS
jgi:hypothetical protein